MDTVRAGFEQDDTADGIGVVTFSRLDAVDLCVLEVRGDLDIAVSGVLGRALDDLLDTGRDRVGVDLSGVPFMDSSALSALVRAHERAKADGTELVLVQPSPACAKVLSITGLDRVFEIR